MTSYLPPGDFNADAAAVTADQHAKDIAALDSRIAKLEAKFGSHEQIAETLEGTAKTAVKMKEMLETNFVELICKNDNVKSKLKAFIKETDREFIIQEYKKYALWIKGALLFVIAQISIELIKWGIHLVEGTH
jgi:hypothetical protein